MDSDTAVARPLFIPPLHMLASWLFKVTRITIHQERSLHLGTLLSTTGNNVPQIVIVIGFILGSVKNKCYSARTRLN